MIYEQRRIVSQRGLEAAISMAAATLFKIMLTQTWARAHEAEAKKIAARDEGLLL